MPLTSATCSFSNVIVALVKSIVSRQSGLENIAVAIVFDPPWNQDNMTDEAKLAMGLL
jgi:metal-sulfur cluster biosynthetic enzyme